MALPENNIPYFIQYVYCNCIYITSFDAQLRRRRNNNYNQICCCVLVYKMHMYIIFRYILCFSSYVIHVHSRRPSRTKRWNVSKLLRDTCSSIIDDDQLIYLACKINLLLLYTCLGIKASCCIQYS